MLAKDARQSKGSVFEPNGAKRFKGALSGKIRARKGFVEAKHSMTESHPFEFLSISETIILEKNSSPFLSDLSEGYLLTLTNRCKNDLVRII